MTTTGFKLTFLPVTVLSITAFTQIGWAQNQQRHRQPHTAGTNAWLADSTAVQGMYRLSEHENPWKKRISRETLIDLLGIDERLLCYTSDKVLDQGPRSRLGWCLMPTIGQWHLISSRYLARHYQEADRNDDLLVDADEIEAYADQYHQARIAEYFSRHPSANRGNDPMLSIDESREIYNRSVERNRQEFLRKRPQADSNRDGRLDDNELFDWASRPTGRRLQRQTRFRDGESMLKSLQGGLKLELKHNMSIPTPERQDLNKRPKGADRQRADANHDGRIDPIEQMVALASQLNFDLEALILKRHPQADVNNNEQIEQEELEAFTTEWVMGCCVLRSPVTIINNVEHHGQDEIMAEFIPINAVPSRGLFRRPLIGTRSTVSTSVYGITRTPQDKQNAHPLPSRAVEQPKILD